MHMFHDKLSPYNYNNIWEDYKLIFLSDVVLLVGLVLDNVVSTNINARTTLLLDFLMDYISETYIIHVIENR